MQAYAEGFELLPATELVTDVPAVLQAWSRGTVVRSWLLDLLVLALKDDAGAAELEGYVDDSGEGRWTIEEAITHAVPLPVISAALFARFASRQDASPAMRAVAALRQQFGGHAVRPRGPGGRPGRPRGPVVGHRLDPRTEPGGVYLRRLRGHRLPVLAERRAGARSGRDGAASARTGWARPTSSRRVGYLATLGSHRVAADAPLIRRGAERAVRPRRGGAPGPRAARRAGDHRGRANRARRERSPVGPAPRRARDPAHACCSRRRTWRWCAATRGSAAGSSTTCWSPAYPRYAGVRADYDRVLGSARRCSSHARDLRAGRARPSDLTAGPSTCLGRPPRPARRGAAGRAARPRGRAGAATRLAAFAEIAPSRTRSRWLTAAASARPPSPATEMAVRTAGRAGGPAARRAGAGCAGRRWSAGCAWSARTATSSSSRSARGRRRATPATASRGRSRSRCGWPRTGCCARTTWSRCCAGRRVRRAGLRAPACAGRPGRARRAGAGDRRGRRGRARGLDGARFSWGRRWPGVRRRRRGAASGCGPMPTARGSREVTTE